MGAGDVEGVHCPVLELMIYDLEQVTHRVVHRYTISVVLSAKTEGRVGLGTEVEAGAWQARHLQLGRQGGLPKQRFKQGAERSC